MNRAMLRISLACLAMFVLLLLNVNYVQAFETTKLAGEPHNVRVFDQQFTYQRGAIIAGGDGTDVRIAESRLVKGSDVSTSATIPTARSTRRSPATTRSTASPASSRPRTAC